jgi:hypothetical protein
MNGDILLRYSLSLSLSETLRFWYYYYYYLVSKTINYLYLP